MSQGARVPEELPFDQYQRYRLVTDVVGRLREALGTARDPLSILDVGGRTALLRQFLESDHVSLVDVEAPDAAAGPTDGLVLGDGSALPFAGASFDVVCAFDTLEHVPPDRREAFVAECRRVARSYVILAGPYDAPAVREAEALLTRFLDDKLAIDHRYLSEHAQHGLPERAAVEKQFATLGGKVVSVGHANLERWCALMCVEMYLDDDPALRAFARDAYAFYNERLYASDHAEPVYRHAVVGAFGGAPLPKLGNLFGAPVAPTGSLEGFGRLVDGLAAFDRERAAWRAERDRFKASVAVLEEDLEQHQTSLDEAREVLAQEVTVRERSEDELSQEQAVRVEATELLAKERAVREKREARVADLEGLVAELEERLEEQAEKARTQAAELEERIGEQAAVVETLELDLEGHKRVAAEDEREKGALLELAAALRAELDQERLESGAAREALELDLAGHRVVQAEDAREKQELGELAAALRAELDQERAESAEARGALESDLEGHRAVIDELRTEGDALRAEQEKLLGMIPKRKRRG